jgi:hypothetical protein
MDDSVNPGIKPRHQAVPATHSLAWSNDPAEAVPGAARVPERHRLPTQLLRPGEDHVATTRPGGTMPKHQGKGRRSGCSIRTSPTKSIQSKMSSDLMNLIELFGGSLPTLPAEGMESLLQFRRYGCGINVARSRRNRSTGRDRQWTPAKWCPPRKCSTRRSSVTPRARGTPPGGLQQNQLGHVADWLMKHQCHAPSTIKHTLTSQPPTGASLRWSTQVTSSC